MAYDKVVDSAALDSIFADIADAVREKNNSTNSIAHTALAAAIRAIQGGEGGYVWKKYPIIEIVQSTTGKNVQFSIDSNSIDLTQVDASFFVGMVIKLADIEGIANFNFISEDTYTWTNSDGSTVVDEAWSYDPTTKTIITSRSVSRIAVWAITNPPFASVDYVVSDDETAYPNGAIHTDGYYYEIFDASGLYVWKRFELKEYSVQFVRLANNEAQAIPTGITYNELELSMLNERIVCSRDSYDYIIRDNALHWVTKGTTNSLGNTSLTYDKSTGKIGIGNSSFQATNEYHSFSDSYKSFLDYVVSDNPNTYPDGAEQGGYWYERVSEFNAGFSKAETGEFVYSSRTLLNTLVINHDLNFVPHFVTVYALEPITEADDLMSLIFDTTWQISSQTGTNSRIGFLNYKTDSTSTGATNVKADAVAVDANSVAFSGLLTTFHLQAGKKYGYIIAG